MIKLQLYVPKEGIALNGKADALNNLGEYTEAIKYYAMDSTNNVNPLSEEGDALKRLGNHREAITYYDKFLAIVT